MTWVLVAACGLASIPAGLRWLRVAQREHYLAPSATRFAWRWWTAGADNIALLAASLVGVAGTLVSPWFGFLVAAAQIGPRRFAVRGVTSPLAWTHRLRRLAILTGAILAVAYIIGGTGGEPFVVVLALFALPLVVDAAAALLDPFERAGAGRWVDRAARRLAAVGPEVVAITGSYGKTSTKNYLAHLLEGSRRTVASPASFNNRLGLARAVNEQLVPGTEVFIAEMGTYGPGEIADLCSWLHPRVGAIVAIGPVHLERFGTEERIVEAKAEILDGVEVGVICVDHPLLAALSRQRSSRMPVIDVSTSGGGRVVVTADEVLVDGVVVAATPRAVFAANLAVAMGMVVAMGIDPAAVASRIADLPVTPHRQAIAMSESGFKVIDDTFNSNPAGTRQALRLLEEVAGAGKKVVVTPGMVELGAIQDDANEEFAAEAAGVADHIVVVGATNRVALLRGSAKGEASVTVAGTRAEAVAWVRENLGTGDTVLYENDLPDHYP